MKNIVIILGSLLLLQSCLEDLSDIGSYEVELESGSIRQDLAIPLLNASVSIQDALDNFETGGYLEVNDDKSMTVVYEGEDVFSLTGGEIVDIKDFEIFVPDTLTEFDYSILNIPLNIDAAILEQGMLDISFESIEQEDLDIEIFIYNLDVAGETFMLPIDLPYNGTAPVKMEKTVSIAGHKLDLSEDMIKVYYRATTPNGTAKRLENFWIDFKDLEYNFIQGSFDPYKFEFEADSISIDVFDDFESGDIFFDDLEINIFIENSYGIPISVGLDYFRTDKNPYEALNLISPLDEGLAVPYPDLSEIGQSKKTAFTFDNSNTNIFDLFNAAPKFVYYKVNAFVNETGSNEVGFVSTSSEIKVDVEVAVPMKFRAEDFRIESSNDFDIDLASLTETGDVNVEIEELEFKLITENGLPIDLELQLFFEDDDGNVLTSLFPSQTELISAAPIDAEGKVMDTTISETFIAKRGSDLEMIDQATQIRIAAMVSTANGGSSSSKFYTDYALDFKLGVRSVLYLGN